MFDATRDDALARYGTANNANKMAGARGMENTQHIPSSVPGVGSLSVSGVSGDRRGDRTAFFNGLNDLELRNLN